MSNQIYENLEEARARGMHQHYILCDDPKDWPLAFKNRDERANFDLTFTLDVNHIPNVSTAIRTIANYKGVTILLTNDLDLNALLGNFALEPQVVLRLQFEEVDNRTPYMTGNDPVIGIRARIVDRIGHISQPVDVAQAVVIRGHVKAAFSIDEGDPQYATAFDAVKTVMAHRALGFNYFVSDNPLIHKLRPYFFTNRAQHLISFAQLYETIERLKRRQGIYHSDSVHTYNKGLYYWREMLLGLPHYDRVWATALHGCRAGVIDKQLEEFTKSLSDRVMSLLHLRDEIENLAEDDPHNDSEWDIVNRLNYFFVLITAVFDNLAWLIAIRYSLVGVVDRHRIVLRFSKNRSTGTYSDPNPFHQQIQQRNNQLYEWIENHQDLLALFYPVRDSIQHRLVISSRLLEYLDQGWKYIVVSLEPETIEALLHQAPAIPMAFNVWGLFDSKDSEYFVEPSMFCKTGMHQVLEFVDETLSIMDVPSLLNSDPSLLARVRQQPAELANLINCNCGLSHMLD